MLSDPSHYQNPLEDILNLEVYKTIMIIRYSC